MRRRLCNELLPGFRSRSHTPRPSPAFLRLLSHETSPRRDSCNVGTYPLHGDATQEPRPFAIERVGGRECHISWPSDGGQGIEKEWRDSSPADQPNGEVAVPTNSLTGRISSWLGQMFLPTSYPQSVHRSYMSFHVLQFFESTLATITSVLCNQALLTSVGVSAEGSIFGAVAVQWIIKDGAGEIAKLFFIRHFSPYFDSHPKTITLFGEVIGCLGSGLQIATVLVSPSPLNFMLCAAGGNIFRLVGSAIWYTTHIKFIRYFSAQGNDGDVAAKDESQASIAQLTGYASGIGLLALSHSPAYLYSIFFLAVPLHLLMTTCMMRVATFELLTMPRLSYLAQTYVADGGVGTVDDLERREAAGLFGEFYKNKNDRWLALAPRVSDVLDSGSEADRSRWEVCARAFKDNSYLLFPSDSPRGPMVSVLFHPDAHNDDMLRSILHAAMVRDALSSGDAKLAPLSSLGNHPEATVIFALRCVLSQTSASVRDQYPGFRRALQESGWRMDELCFADHGHRVTWTPWGDASER